MRPPGERIQAERGRRGLSQKELADLLDVTQPFVSQMERQLVELPGDDVRRAFVEQWGFDPYARRAAVRMSKLSASEAAVRHGIDLHALLRLIRTRKIRARFLGDGRGFELDEEKLGDD